MRHDLKNGDRVTAIFGKGNAPDGVKNGVEVTLVRAGATPYVKFDDPSIGWADGEGNAGCWYIFDEDKLTKVKPKKTKTPNGPQAYKGNGNHTWEPVTPNGISGTHNVERLRVPGGWLYRSDYTGSMTFVPTPAVVGYKI